MTVRAWTFAAVAALVLPLQGVASAQDRPLLEPLRIGYVQTESIGERLHSSHALEHALRRKGFLASWVTFADGLAAIRSLDAGDVDIALDVSLSDVVAAKRERLQMVFIAELRSIAPSCCDQELLFADHMFKRYTLSSEYLADQREDALLVLHQAMIAMLQRVPEQPYAAQSKTPRMVAGLHRPRNAILGQLVPVTRESLQEASHAARLTPAGTDITDVNYWRPSQY